MAEREIKLEMPVSSFFKETIASQKEDFQAWAQEAVWMGLMVEDGKIYQKVGESFLRVRMADFEPLFDPSQHIGLMDKRVEIVDFSLSDKLIDKIRSFSHSEGGDWLRRAFNLLVMADHLGLYFKKENEFRVLFFEPASA